ncbi:uncharacterized protein MAM_01300 [Metarhizium album ARSEF 1941]|uniref:Uncharacterized protein n=1 Tax=Metarhizium album (strain ARSEF 1941) TaxID=1081103 RepID=A0A0B2WWD4_METAS|nr:uncharacterized protein MAM_01300 [Metarhizium album ARSEF 1941]KHO00522.1 hypothetical protein MAM_01300 [Metarhizium album ARSEF 1941]
MPLNIIASQFFLPLSSVKLARFITSIESPVQGYHDPIYARTPEPTISSRQSYVGLNHDSNNTSFGFALTSLMSAAFSRRVKTRVKVMADCVRTYSLDNSDEWFTEAVAKSGTKTWIERAVDRGYNIYMVVGFHTVTNARIAHEVVQDKNAGGQVKVPVGFTLAAVGAIAPLGDIIDPSVGGNKQSINNSQASFMATGEHICALQYRKVRHRWFSSNNIDTSRLSKSHWWSSVERGRDEEDGEDDIIKVEAIPVAEEELRGEWDKMEAPEGEILLIQKEEQVGKQVTD